MTDDRGEAARWAISMASRVSVRVPIWFTLIRMLLVQPSAMPRDRRSVLVTKKSSPTTWTLPQRLGEGRVAGPIVLVEWVLDRDDRILFDPGSKKIDYLLAGEDLIGADFQNL